MNLQPFEVRMLRLLINGHSYEEIAAKFCITQNALKERIYRMRKRHQARSNIDLLRKTGVMKMEVLKGIRR
jgi:DNA-binding NarL/FixJ family response regulator